MNTRPAKILVMAGDRSACIRIVGRASFISSVDFKALVDDLRQKGCNCFVLDLTECVLMDSTFLGVLAGLGLKLANGNGGSARQGVELYNPSPRIIDLLETLGVLHLFKVTDGSPNAALSGDAVEHTSTAPSKSDMSRTCIEAHQTLMAINPENEARFKDVTQFLADGLKKAKAD